MNLTEAIRAIRPLDGPALAEAGNLLERLTKPSGSLGVLEEVAARLAGLAGVCPPPIPRRPVVAIFAGDHGVHARAVTPWPQQVTAQMVTNFLDGGAVVNAFARQVGAEVTVVDVGVAHPYPLPTAGTGGPLPGGPADPRLIVGPGGRLRVCRVRPGTRDLSVEPALTRAEAIAAVETGIEVAEDLVSDGHDLLVTGDMGIANTTPAAALVAAFAGTDPSAATGRGTGIDDATLIRKTAVVASALIRQRLDPSDAVGVLAAVGGLEHAALAGFVLGGAAARVPVILDGLVSCAAALAAAVLAPDAVGAMVAGHRSPEPGAAVALGYLGLRPLLDLGMRLGEGTGGLLALPIVASAIRALHEVATFDSANVAARLPPPPPPSRGDQGVAARTPPKA